MIAANELRLGNWIFLAGYEVRVTDLRDKMINSFPESMGIGIELTPENLEKAGFQKKDNGYWLGESYYFDGKDLWYFPYDCPNESYADQLPAFIHWLQNHYYFTKREELKIEL